MTIAKRLTLSAFAVLAAACGDNSQECGEGTIEQDGLCVAEVVPPVVCTEGTLFDDVTNACVVDPASCQGGTVLIRGRCQDPTANINPDLEEGAEPNGLGMSGEDSVTPAGVITMPAIGSPGVVLHGRIAPQADRNSDGVPEADIDTFVVDAAGPTVLEITADGVNGLTAGFVVGGDADGLETWVRAAVNLTGDTARRRLFLPTAGRYRIGISDSRSLTFPPAVVGGDSAEYYVTVEQRSLTTPQPITLAAGEATQLGTIEPLELDFFSVPLGTGQNDLELSTQFAGTMAGLVVLVDDVLAGADDELKFDIEQPAALVIAGVQAGESVTIVVDHRITGTTTPVPYALDIVARSTLR